MVLELIPVLGSQPAGDIESKPVVGCHYSALRGLLPILLLGEQEAQWVWTVCLRLLPNSVVAAIWTRAPESSTLTTRLPNHPEHRLVNRPIPALFHDMDITSFSEVWYGSVTVWHKTHDKKHFSCQQDSPSNCEKAQRTFVYRPTSASAELHYWQYKPSRRFAPCRLDADNILGRFYLHASETQQQSWPISSWLTSHPYVIYV